MPSSMPLDLDAALRYLVHNDGSDLHLKAGAPPMTRMDGALRPVEGLPPLTAEETEAAVHHMLHDPNKLREFAEENEVDFSYAIEGVARFRVNAFRQRGDVSIVARAIPVDIRSIEDLALPAGRRDARRGGARHRPADRHDRLRQVDDARRDDRPHQLDARPSRRHDRGPDRVPAPRTSAR